MAVEFKKNDQKQISQWIGARRGYKLLYKISRDGCSSTTFHNMCNNKGPTVTLLYNVSGSVYGGYTSISWKSTNGHQNDSKAFLFRLYQNGTFLPINFPVTRAEHGIYDHRNNGPVFGGGYDLVTFNGTIDFNGTTFSLNGNVNNLGHSYNIKGENANSICNGNLEVVDLEVYTVEDNAGGPLDFPWRKTPDWDQQLLNELKTDIARYKPLKGLNVEQARILLIGQVGAGKSSFFNTINSIFRGYISSQACSGDSGHSLTTEYRMYQVRDGPSGKPMKFRLCDTRGLETDQGIDSQELRFIIDGHVRDGHQFNPSVPISSEADDYKPSPDFGDKIHCVAFVIDSSTIDVMPEKILKRIRSLQTRLNQKGVPQVVLLTNVDKICPLTAENVSQVFYSSVVQETVDNVSQIMGLPRAHILPVKNYESETKLEKNVNILALLTMQQVLRFADDFMYNYLDVLQDGNMKQMMASCTLV